MDPTNPREAEAQASLMADTGASTPEPAIAAAAAPRLQQVVQAAQTKMLDGPSLGIQPTQFPVDSATLAKQKQAREAKAGFFDYLGNMWRQDTFVDGLMASMAGDNTLLPDPSYIPYEPKEWKELTAGVPDEYHSVFYRAHSAAHARYLKDMIAQKIDDQTNLGDLGVPGNIARVAFGFVEPTTLAAGIMSGGAASALKGAKAIAAGLGTAGAIGGGFEAVRQHYSFEDNPTAILEAALITTAFSTPFVGLNARSMKKLTTTAGEERKALQVAREVAAGKEPTPEQAFVLKQAEEKLKHVHDIETGKVDAVEHDMHVTAFEREQAYRGAQSQLDAKKSKEIDALWADGHVAQAEAAIEKAHIEASNLGNQSQLGEAFRAAQERKASAVAKKAAASTTGLTEGMKGAAQAITGNLYEGLFDALKNGRSKFAGIADPLLAKAKDAFARGEIKSADDLRAFANAPKAAPVVDPKTAEIKDLLTKLGIRKEEPVAPVAHEAPVGSGPDVAPVETPTSHLGQEVLWRDGDAVDTGTVVGKNSKGSLKVDLYASLPEGHKPASGPRYKWLRPEELDPDSPLYSDPGETSGFMSGSVGAAQINKVANVWDDLTAMSKVRFDIFARLNRSSNPVMRELGWLMVKDAVQISKHEAQGWTASEIKKQIQRTQGGYFHTEAKAAFDEAMKKRNVGFVGKTKTHKEFYENVSKVARGDTEVLKANPDIAPELQKAASAMNKVFADVLTRAQKAGVQGAMNVTTGGQYVPRIWNHNNIREAIKRYGKPEVMQLIEHAIRAPGVKDPAATAAKFMSAVSRLETQHAMQDIQLVGRDMLALRKELDAVGLTKGEIDAIVDVMFAQHKTGAQDAGNAGNLKFRFDLDENYHEVQKDGSKLTVSDLFENDSRLVMDKYLASMGGHTAMAEKGIHSRAEFMQKLKAADDEHSVNGYEKSDASKYNEERQLATDMYDNITGRPMSMQPFNKADRYLGAFRAYTRSTMLGQLGVAAASEMINVVGLSTSKAFWQQLPAYRQVILAARSGQRMTKTLASDIETWQGFGLEQAATYARQHEISEFTLERGTANVDNMANKLSHGVDVLSGNSWLTSATRKYAAMIAVQDHHNLATGKSKLTPKMRERLVGHGIDDSEIDDVLRDLKDHTTKTPSGRVESIDWEKWQQANQKTYDAYTLAVQRTVRDGIQDHDIGETWAVSHTQIGKIFGELRTFMMASHGKQTLKNLYYHDERALNTFAFTFAGQSLAYIAQTSANFAHNPAELDKRLTLDRIAKATIQRMSIMGITPMIFESAYYVGSGGQSFFKGGSTNTDNRNLFVTPSMVTAGRLMTGASVGVGKLNPFSSSVTTKQEASDAFAALPGGNLYLMRNINDAISSQFPKKEPKQQ